MTFSSDVRAQDSTSSVTGCLDSDGNFSEFAFGDAPVQGCATGQDELALQLDDLRAGVTRSFFVTLRLGEEQVLAVNGALELRARCTLGTTTGGDALELVVTSELDGWFATSAGTSTTRPLLAREEIVLFTARSRPDQGRLSGFDGDRLVGAQLALAPDGSFIALPTGSTALGIHLFDQDCLVVGAATLIQGDLPPPRGISRDIEQAPRQISGGVQIGDRISRDIDQFSGSLSDDDVQAPRGISRDIEQAPRQISGDVQIGDRISSDIDQFSGSLSDDDVQAPRGISRN